MIVKDKSIYLNYVKDIEEKIKKLCSNVSFVTMPDTLKQDPEKVRVKISAKLALLTQKANQPELIPNAEWVNFKQEINALYQELADKVNQCATWVQQTNNSIGR